MSSVNVDELSNALAASTVSSSGVSFCGQALKLDTEEDGKSKHLLIYYRLERRMSLRSHGSKYFRTAR